MIQLQIVKSKLSLNHVIKFNETIYTKNQNDTNGIFVDNENKVRRSTKRKSNNAVTPNTVYVCIYSPFTFSFNFIPLFW